MILRPHFFYGHLFRFFQPVKKSFSRAVMYFISFCFQFRGEKHGFFHYLNAVSRVDFLVKKITGKFQFTWVLIGVISDFFTAIVFSRPFFQIFPFFVACMILICTEKKYCTKYRSIQPE